MFKIDNEFPTRISDMRRTHSMTQTELAEAVGITQRQVAAYEAGSAKPRENTLLSLAYHLGVAPSWLASGENTNEDEWDNFIPPISLMQIPIYQLNKLTDQEIRGRRNLRKTDHGFHPLPAELENTDKNLFAIKIIGDSMETFGKLGMPESSIVIFNPNEKCESGDICLIKLFDNQYTIKQLFIDTNQVTAHPLNPNYADMVFRNEDYKIMAKAVHVSITL